MTDLVCSWINHGETSTCGREATKYRNFALCDDHIVAMLDRSNRERRSTPLQAAKQHPLESFPGYCYIVLLPDGYIKIGYSNTTERLEERFKELNKEYKAPVVKLAVIKGGFVAEAVLHQKFDRYREPGVGERFRYTPEIAMYLEGLPEGTQT